MAIMLFLILFNNVIILIKQLYSLVYDQRTQLLMITRGYLGLGLKLLTRYDMILYDKIRYDAIRNIRTCQKTETCEDISNDPCLREWIF